MNKITNFTKQVLARLKGDTAGVIAAKNEAYADNSIKSQIQALEGRLMDEKVALKDAQENLSNSTYPTELIVPKGSVDPSSSRRRYIDSLLKAEERRRDAEDAVKDTEKSIQFFKDVLVAMTENVEVEAE